MGTVRVKTGDAEFDHEDYDPVKVRFLRVRWIVSNLADEQVGKAISEKRVAMDSSEFVRTVRQVISRVEAGEAQPTEIHPLMADRMEDIWTMASGKAELDDGQRKKVKEWLARDGAAGSAKHSELLESIEKSEAEEAKKNGGGK